MPPTDVTLCWALSSETGWGLLGKYTALNLQERYQARLQIASKRNELDLDIVERSAFATIEQRSARLRAKLPPPEVMKVGLSGVAVQAIANGGRTQFRDTGLDIVGERNVALVFSEVSRESAEAVALLNARFDTVIAGSSWSAAALRRAGVHRVALGIQGVDRRLFVPAAPRDLLRDRFIVFSGGKFEYRKGQDIVLEAFRRFRRRHPEALLYAMWSNQWLRGRPLRMFELSPHAAWIPKLKPKDGAFDWNALLGRLDLGGNDITIFGSLPHRSVANIIRYADVAVFPNRAEAGTNMVAMQTMACGIPTILSANTGHLDILEDGACLPLTQQTPIGERTLAGETEPDGAIVDWGESSVDEVEDRLEYAYREREAARRIGETGARWMARFNWPAHAAVVAEAAGLEPR